MERSLVTIPGGDVQLEDARSRRRWTVHVAPFRLASTPVTREDFYATDPDWGGAGGRHPVTDVSWEDAVRYCNRLSAATGRSPCYLIADDDVNCDWEADGFRLPSEAEWEHACRAGTSGPTYAPLRSIAWYRDNAGGGVHDVAGKTPNPWGLYDMLGNVWEWCWDLLDPVVYGEYRVFRGGGWSDAPWSCRASCRRGSHPTFHIDDLGFRVATSR